MRRTTAVLIVLLATGVAPVTAQAQEPHEFQALIGLARVERDSGDMAAARRYFDEARLVHPLDPGQLAEYFWVLVGRSPREAIDVGREVLNHDPADGKVRDRTITAAIGLHDEDRVAALAAEGRRLDPGAALWARRLAESAMRGGRAAEAARQYAAAMTGTGAVVDDRAGLALALEAAGQDARAMEVWQSVPATARAAHPEWERSRLRVMADAASARVAADALETWVTAHPADTAMRGLLVERWAAAGEPARALAAVGPLTSGPAAEHWWRRAAQLARAAGNRRDAISAFARLAVAGTATAADLHDLVELLIENGEFDRAAGFLTPVVLAAGCDDASMGLVDRLPDPAATDLMFRAVERHTGACASHPRWMQRSVDRLVAAGRHADALKVLDAMPAPSRGAIADRRLRGQLRLWTGDTAGAIAVLIPVVDAAPDDVAAREALVDALRAAGRSYEAWSASRPLVDAAATSAAGTDRLLGLAHLALEADEPGMVGPVLARLDAAAGDPVERTSLRAEAALALGRPADARRLLASVDPHALAPDAALALIDGTMAMDGPGAALGVARVFTSGTPAWRDVLARRALLEAVVGDAQRFASLRAALGTLDRTAVPVLDAEVALAEERPHDALAALRAIPEAQVQGRTNDLLSTALAGTGNLSAARDRLAQLRHARPRFVPFAIREADLAWRAAPSAATLSAVLDLPTRFPGDWNAVIEAALVLETSSRPADALARLGGETHLADVPLAGRLVAARALRTLGRARDALALLDGVPAISGRAAVLHAQLLASVEGWPRANRAFAALAARASATPWVFLAWASAAPTPADRAPVLAGAAVRFPDDPDVLSALATARWQTGDREGAREAAEHAVDCSTGSSDAWLVYIDATAATRSRADLDRVLQQFISTSADDAALVTGVAEHLAGLARAPDDPLLARSLDWLATAPPDASLADARDLARARVLAAARRFGEALETIDDVIARRPANLAAARLRADVLSWAGRYDESLAAYDAYLAAAPLDTEARRQQARVAGWSGDVDRAERLYRDLVQAHPDDPVLAAEAAAKTAFLTGRWRVAIPAYQKWLALEPDDTEAQFELAESQRATGALAAADDTLRALASLPSPHRLAADALARTGLNRTPSAIVTTHVRSANGYGGQRLLDLREQDGVFTHAWGGDDATVMSAEGADVRAAGAGSARAGYRVGLSGTHRLSPAWQVEAAAARWTFGSGSGVADLQGLVTWRPVDRWTLVAGATRQPIFESLTTVDERLAASGVLAEVQFASPVMSVDARVARQSLSDGNARSDATVSASRAVGERWRGLRAVLWGEHLSYRREAAGYFSPSAFTRVDGGIEYDHDFTAPRFRGDRRNTLALGYLVGFDGRGGRYQHPSIRLSLELRPGLTLDASAGTIRSADYRETTALVSLRIGGLTPQ